MSTPASVHRDESVFLARQPILDRTGRVRAYELLCRNGAADLTCEAASPDAATARVLHGAMMHLGLDTLTPGCPAFVNVTRNLLSDDLGAILPPANVVIEVLETVEVDDEVVEVCRSLHAKGYALALDDFVPGSSAERLFPYARYIKVDVLAIGAATRRQLVKSTPQHLCLLAEKVETAEMFAETAAEGFELFQGYYFCRPSMVQTRDVSAQQITALRLLEALHRPSVSISELDDLIRRDVSLCQRVLRYVNSPALGVSRQIHSIHHALTLIGLDPIRKWVSIWSLAGLNQAQTPEVMTMAVVRARCCERFGASVLGGETGGESFLLGLCSLLDVLLDRPMADILRAVSLPQKTASALLGHQARERDLLDAVIAFERGHWDEGSRICRTLGAQPSDLSGAFAEALQWARGVC